MPTGQWDEDQQVTRSDVPYGWRTGWMVAIVVALLIGWVLLIISTPEVRPGVVELCVGVVFGSIASRIYVPALIAVLAEVSLDTRRYRWLKWTVFIMRPIGSFRNEAWRWVSGALVAYLGVFGVLSVLYVIWRMVPGLKEPWARFHSTELGAAPPAVRSWPSTGVVFCLAFLDSTLWRIIQWYKSLP